MCVITKKNLRFNNKDKNHIIGKFKLPYSLNGPIHNVKKWVYESETQEVENLVGGMFVTYLRNEEKRDVMYYYLNEDDSNKNPDLYVHLDGRHHSVQVTQLVLNDFLTKFNQTKRICEKISNYIIEIYKPPMGINIQIYPPWENSKFQKAPQKVYKRLAKVIAKIITENIEKLKIKNEYLDFELDKEKFGKIADSFNLLPIPEKYKSNYFGSNNIFIDYEFDDIKISQDDIKNSVEKVFKDKNEGNSEILIVWGDENQFMQTEPLILEQLKRIFIETTFKSVYFLTFRNILDMKNISIHCSKVY